MFVYTSVVYMSGPRKSKRIAEEEAKKIVEENETKITVPSPVVAKSSSAPQMSSFEKEEIDNLVQRIKGQQQDLRSKGHISADYFVPDLDRHMERYSPEAKEYFMTSMGIDMPIKMSDDDIEDHFYKMDMRDPYGVDYDYRYKAGKRKRKSKSKKSRKTKISRKSKKSRKIKKSRKSRKSRKTKKRKTAVKKRTRTRKAGVAPPPRRPSPDLPLSTPEVSDDENESSPGHIAAERGDIEGVRNWLDSRPGDISLLLEQMDDVGETMLFIAAENGHANIVRILIDDYGADIRNPSINGSDVLEHAREGAFNVEVTNIIERRA